MVRTLFKDNWFFERIRKNIPRLNKYELILCLAVFSYAVFFSYYAVLKHWTFQTTWYDLGLYNKALWYTAFKSQIISFQTHSIIYILVLPFYMIFSKPETLLIVQSFALAFGAIPLYYLAKAKAHSEIVSLSICLVYLLYPALHGINTFDFHSEAFIPLFMLLSLYFYEKKQFLKYYVCIILLLTTIEYIAIILLWFSLILIIRSYISISDRFKLEIRQKESTFHYKITAGIAIFWLIITSLMLHYVNLSVVENYSTFLDFSINNILLNLPAKMQFIGLIFAPLLFISFLSSDIIFTLPYFIIGFASAKGLTFSNIYNHYPSFVIPFVFLSLVSGLEKLKFRKKYVISLIVMSTIIFNLGFNALIINPWPTYTPRVQTLSEMAQLVPKNASVYTQNDFFPQFRPDKVYGVIDPNKDHVDFVLVDTSSYYYYHSPVNPPPSSSLPLLLEKVPYGVYSYSNGVVLFKREYNFEPVFLEFDNFTFFGKDMNYLNNTIVLKDEESKAKNVLAHISGEDGGVFWFGPYIILSSGTYLVTVSLKCPNDTSLQNGTNLITIKTTTEFGKKNWSTLEIGSSNFKTGSWQTFNLLVSFNETVTDFEIVGVEMPSEVTLYLDYIQIIRLA